MILSYKAGEDFNSLQQPNLYQVNSFYQKRAEDSKLWLKTRKREEICFQLHQHLGNNV